MKKVKEEKKVKKYYIYQGHPVNSEELKYNPKYHENNKRKIEWIRLEDFGSFEDKFSAILWFLVEMKELNGSDEYSEEFVERFFKPFTNMGLYKVGVG